MLLVVFQNIKCLINDHFCRKIILLISLKLYFYKNLYPRYQYPGEDCTSDCGFFCTTLPLRWLNFFFHMSSSALFSLSFFFFTTLRLFYSFSCFFFVFFSQVSLFFLLLLHFRCFFFPHVPLSFILTLHFPFFFGTRLPPLYSPFPFRFIFFLCLLLFYSPSPCPFVVWPNSPSPLFLLSRSFFFSHKSPVLLFALCVTFFWQKAPFEDYCMH